HARSALDGEVAALSRACGAEARGGADSRISAKGGIVMKNEMPLHVAARASVVNRTHRVVRERATVMAARRSRVRSLWIPIAVSSALLVIICTAVWSVLNQYDLNPNG